MDGLSIIYRAILQNSFDKSSSFRESLLMTYNYLFNNSPKLYVALRDLYQLSFYFKNCTCKGIVLDGFGIATVEVEISSTVPCDIENSLIRIIFRSDCANECIILIDGHTNIGV